MTSKPNKHLTPDILNADFETLENWVRANFHSIEHTKSFNLLLQRMRRVEAGKDQLINFVTLFDRWDSSIRCEVREITFDDLKKAREALKTPPPKQKG